VCFTRVGLFVLLLIWCFLNGVSWLFWIRLSVPGQLIAWKDMSLKWPAVYLLNSVYFHWCAVTLSHICHLTRLPRHTRYLVLCQYCLVATYELTCILHHCGPRLLSIRMNYKCRILAMYIGAALYRVHARVINCTAFNVLIRWIVRFRLTAGAERAFTIS